LMNAHAPNQQHYERCILQLEILKFVEMEERENHRTGGADLRFRAGPYKVKMQEVTTSSRQGLVAVTPNSNWMACNQT